MKNFIFALGFAVIAATAAATGANAFSAPRVSLDGASPAVTQVGYYGHYKYDYHPRSDGKFYRYNFYRYGGWYGRKHYSKGYYGHRRFGWYGRHFGWRGHRYY